MYQNIVFQDMIWKRNKLRSYKIEMFDMLQNISLCANPSLDLFLKVVFIVVAYHCDQ